jgi:hypothetical protein
MKQMSADRLNDLMVRAHEGDRSVLPAIRKQLDAHPELWREAGDLAIQSQNSLVVAMAGENDVAREALHRRLAGLRRELMGPNPTPLESLLIERILVCWLQVHHADATNLPSSGPMTVSQGEYYRRRLEGAQRRYLAAMRALAVVRRLQIPIVQVNIADKQVNVAGGGGG